MRKIIYLGLAVGFGWFCWFSFDKVDGRNAQVIENKLNTEIKQRDNQISKLQADYDGLVARMSVGIESPETQPASVIEE